MSLFIIININNSQKYILTTTQKQEKNQIYSKAFPIIAAIFCMVFALWSALWFWSSVLTVRPETVITEWERDNNEYINQVLALKMLTRLEQSIAINPLDANSHLLMARYYEALAHNKPLQESNDTKKIKSNNYSEQAEKEYKLTIKHQPSWDYAWAKQANFYSHESKLNETAFIHAISKAMLLGPYEGKTQAVIIPLIFKHWSLLFKNKKNQEQAIRIIKHALKFHINALITLDAAKKYQRLAELAPLLTKKWHKNRLKKYLRETTHE